MRSATQRTILIFATALIGAIGLGFFGWVLLGTLQPTDVTLRAHELEVDLSKLEPGQVMRLDWEGTEVFVLHRSPKQIEWLKTYTPPQLQQRAADELFSKGLANRLRSFQDKYLVVGIWKNGKYFMVMETTRQAYRCDDFKYSGANLQVRDDVSFPGGFYCASMYGSLLSDFKGSSFVYDPAGRSISPWVVPLQVPPHKLEGDKLVLGKRG